MARIESRWPPADICRKGDSGAGVFALRKKKATTVTWVGMLVGMEKKTGDGSPAGSVGLMIPQRVVLSHLATWSMRIFGPRLRDPPLFSHGGLAISHCPCARFSDCWSADFDEGLALGRVISCA
jgi:hypothetical protein